MFISKLMIILSEVTEVVTEAGEQEVNDAIARLTEIWQSICDVNWWFDNIIDIVLWLLGIIGTMLATRLVNKIASWFASKAKNEKSSGIIETIKDIIVSSTNATTQDFVSNLKKCSSFTGDAQKEAMQKTIDAIKAQLSDEAINYIKKNYSDVDTYLTTQVENVIDGDHKDQSTSVH